MEFVGIRNYSEKERLLRGGTDRLVQVPTRDLAYDCLRHLDFLTRLDSDVTEDITETIYWKYLIAMGKEVDTARERCKRFIQLYEHIRSRGIDYSEGYVAVTEDGIRLNGSHRVAIAKVLGLETLWVKSYRWEDQFPERRIRLIREEARVKRETQARYLGLEAYDGLTLGRLGRVVFVDATPVRDGPWKWFRRKRMEPMVALLRPSGDLLFSSIRNVVLK